MRAFVYSYMPVHSYTFTFKHMFGVFNLLVCFDVLNFLPRIKLENNNVKREEVMEVNVFPYITHLLK